MCGIAGIVKQKIDKDLFNQMVDMVSYRGPDDKGTWFEDNLALGHRRLSIIDISDAGHQPFVYNGRYVLVFNGEIYNYIELRKELESEGLSFKTQTDTEVLASAFARWGDKCLNRLNGMWSFAFYDRVERKLYCSRDRYGVKPFYYYTDRDSFIFGSEIKQILHMLPGRPKANEYRLKEYLLFGIIDSSDETMFDGIYQLEPGEMLSVSVDDLRIHKERYYDVSKVISKRYRGSFSDASDLFYARYRDAVMLRHRSDVKVGYCLSGGLDSSSNVSMAHHIFPKVKQETVSSCSEYPEYDEWEYAEEVVKQTGCISHKLIPDGKKLFDELDDLIWHMDEPFGTTSIYASRCVFKECQKNGLTVMLDGQGADEQLAGYTWAYSIYFRSLFKRIKWVKLGHEIASYKNNRLGTESDITVKDTVIIPVFKDLIPKRLSEMVRKRRWSSNIYSTFVPDSEELALKKRIASDEKWYLKSQMTSLRSLLHYEDRNTMTYSIESRLPFLDYRLVEFVLS